MSGECEKCGEHALECNCGSLCRHQQNDRQHHHNRMNMEILPLEDCLDPPEDKIPIRWVNVCGRKEHEAIIKDEAKCNELGLDQVYETIVYLKRWGAWLS